MSEERELLEMLADGGVHSGVDLARNFSVSRAVVWKRVQSLRAKGAAIEAIAGGGYWVPRSTRPLAADRVLASMLPQSRRLLGGLEIVQSTGSTNDDLRAAASALPHNSVRVAEHQTGGRGRRGNLWHSPMCAGLWFSLLARIDGGMDRLAGLSLAISVMISDALQAQGVEGIVLKWPNDIWIGRRKLGGILVDLAGDPNGPSIAIIGIGVNVALPPASVRAIDAASTDLVSVTGRDIDRSRLLAALLDGLLPGLDRFHAEGFEPFQAGFCARDALRDRRIDIEGGVVRRGVAAGIDAQGRLRVRSGNVVHAIGAGEVRVRESAVRRGPSIDPEP